jgi:DNA-binding Lrp family transcriptional regulator
MPQLTLPQRQLLQELQAQQLSQAAIARRLGVHRSTVKRELERNTVNGKYSAVGAQEKYTERRQKAGRLNQKKRFVRFYPLEQRIVIRAKKLISLEERTADSAPSKKRSYRRKEWGRRRLFRNCFQPGRKRTGRRQFRRQSYWSWKRWYDNRWRDRCYYVEELGRNRSWMWKYLYRRPETPWYLKGRGRLGLRVLRRLEGPLESDREKIRAYWEARLTVKNVEPKEKTAEMVTDKKLSAEPPLLRFVFFYCCLLSAVNVVKVMKGRASAVMSFCPAGREPP